MSLNKPINQKT